MSNGDSNEIYCLSYFLAKQEHRDSLIESLNKLIEPTRAEKGCLQYELLLDIENPNFIIMLEKFASQQALNDHEQKAYIKYFVENEMWQYCENVTWNVAREIRNKCS